MKRILVACEYSGTVSSAFRALGHEAYSCDLLPYDGDCPIGRKHHIEGDAVPLAYSGQWDMIIAHPPCTRLANSGVRWLAERNLWEDMKEAATLFNTFRNAPCDHVCVENPIPHKYARELIGKPSQYVQPWHFGHNESKATGLWLKGLPLLVPEVTEKPADLQQSVWLESPSADRWKKRSTTFSGIAKAMAEQWGDL